MYEGPIFNSHVEENKNKLWYLVSKVRKSHPHADMGVET